MQHELMVLWKEKADKEKEMLLIVHGMMTQEDSIID
jgi:hypothetical protein